MISKRTSWMILVAALVAASGTMAQADTFGSGLNQFTLDFVPISGATNPTSGYGIVNNDYRMGTYEITNDQWNKFKANLSPVAVTGSPTTAYDSSFYAWGANTTTVPTNNVSWYEAAQFVNYLNTSTGHTAAYKFTGTQGTSNYTFVPWSAGDSGYNASNPYRNSNAYYFLPTENEWVKAAYWNGTALQTYATKTGDLFQGNGTNGGWNFYTTQFATNPRGTWAVGSGSQELNGTYDMMGNAWEWMETPWVNGDYSASSSRGLRGGSFYDYGAYTLASSNRYTNSPTFEDGYLGFRVASVPEPGSISLLIAGAMAGLLWWKRK